MCDAAERGRAMRVRLHAHARCAEAIAREREKHQEGLFLARLGAAASVALGAAGFSVFGWAVLVWPVLMMFAALWLFRRGRMR